MLNTIPLTAYFICTVTQAKLKPTQIHGWQIKCVSQITLFDLVRELGLFQFFSKKIVYLNRFLTEKLGNSETYFYKLPGSGLDM